MSVKPGVAVMAVLAALFVGQTAARAQEVAADQELNKAVAVMRNVEYKKMTDNEKQAKAQEITAAWKTITSAGKAGSDRLKAEIAAVDKSGKPDDFFKLGATALLWEIGKLDEAKTIAAVWNAVPLEKQYTYVLFTAMQAAATQDERALPMLKACLKDDKGQYFSVVHVMTFAFPLTHECIWGTYGPKGLPVLAEVLAKSSNPVERKSAMLNLCRAQYLPALPTVRKLAAEDKGELRLYALRGLGIFGQPQDYDLLIGALKSKNPREQEAAAYGLYEFGDMRAAAALAPLLESDDPKVRSETFEALGCLLSVESVKAIHNFASMAQTPEEKQRAQGTLAAILKAVKVADWNSYDQKPEEEKKKLLAALLSTADQKYALKPDDRKLTHEQLVEAAKEWKAAHRITGGKYDWVEDRHVLAAATAADLDLILDVKGALYARLSDECLDEVRILDGIVSRLGRSRYRTPVGLGETVKEVKAKAGS